MGDVKEGWRGGLRVTRWRFPAVVGCSGASVALPRGPPWAPVFTGDEGGGCVSWRQCVVGVRVWPCHSPGYRPPPVRRRGGEHRPRATTPSPRTPMRGPWGMGEGPFDDGPGRLGCVRPNCHPTMGTGFHRYDEEGSRREPIRQRMGASTPCQTTPSPPKDLRSHGRIGFRMKMNSTLQAARMRSRPRPEQ